MTSNQHRDVKVKVADLISTQIAYIHVTVFGKRTPCIIDTASETCFIGAISFYENKDKIQFVFLPRKKTATVLGNRIVEITQETEMAFHNENRSFYALFDIMLGNSFIYSQGGGVDTQNTVLKLRRAHIQTKLYVPNPPRSTALLREETSRSRTPSTGQLLTCQPAGVVQEE